MGILPAHPCLVSLLSLTSLMRGVYKALFDFCAFAPSNGTLSVDWKQGCLGAAIISKGFSKDIIPVDILGIDFQRGCVRY